MKKLLGLIFAMLVVYVIYIDLTVGTLPSASTEKVEAKAPVVVNSGKTTPYFEAKVKPGDTLISIVEHNLNKAIPVSITDLTTDFRNLNSGKAPEKIQIGASYKFPDYSKK